jgi:hypothetical protein
MLITAHHTIVKLWNQSRCPTIEEWIKNMQNGVLFSHKEEQNYVFCRKMDRIEERWQGEGVGSVGGRRVIREGTQR